MHKNMKDGTFWLVVVKS